MKVFIADTKPKGYISSTDYHWCDDNDLLMFGQFQLDKPHNISMCGILSRKFTTHIIVKDLNINKDFYRELLTESVQKAMECSIDENGNYEIDMGFSHKFNIEDIMNELLEKANQFQNNQKVKCNGRTLSAY